MMNLSGMNPLGQDLLKGIVLIIAALLRPTRGRRHVLREGTGVLGARRGELTEHLRTHKKDFASRRGLLMMVSRRRRLLDYLKKVSPQRYLDIIRRLDIRK